MTQFTKALRRAQAELAQLTGEAQNEALAMRMVPIAWAFDPLPAPGTRPGAQVGKLVQVVIEGAPTR